MLNFEQFTAHSRDAQLVEVREGCVEIDGHKFFNPSLKSRRRVRVFVDDIGPWLSAVCFSERGNFIGSAVEMDAMGLDIVKPDYMPLLWCPWPFMEAESWG